MIMGNKLSFDIAADELDIFLEEANEHLQALETGILTLERSVEPSILNAIFRAAHTLKALGGTIGHQRLAELTHKMETLFDVMRSGEFTPTQSVIDDLLAAVDILKKLLGEIISQEASEVDVTGIITRLTAALTADDHAAASKNNPDPTPLYALTPEQVNQAKHYLETGQNLLEIRLNVTAGAFAPAARLSQGVIALLEVGKILAQQPSLTDLANSQHNGCLWAVLTTSAPSETVTKILADVSDLSEFQVQPYPLKTTPAAAPPPKAAPSPNGVQVQGGDKTIRISVERLDALVNLVGEMVTSRNRLLQLEGNWRHQANGHGTGHELNDIIGHVSRVVDQLQEEVMAARMVPIAALFEKFPRIVRDVARITGKEVNLVIEGGATELDRSLIEVIGDPLIHLLRNAVDHGIEPPQERVAVGKAVAGVVRLTAAHLEGQIVITIADDGRGIDPQKVRRAALKRGLLSEGEVSQLDDEAIIDLIFQPNLSTSEQVTEVSGRGVGMDVVRSNVERLNGSVVVESSMGYGTTFRVTLPLTLAIVQAMLVSVNGGVYAIPLASIIESLYVLEQMINTIKGRPAIQWRNSILPLLDLRDFFKSRQPLPAEDGPRVKNSSKLTVVTVNSGKLKTGLVVDKIIGKQDIVVKSISPIIGEVPGLSGGAILGNGEIALIVDVPNLINNAALRLKKQLL